MRRHYLNFWSETQQQAKRLKRSLLTDMATTYMTGRWYSGSIEPSKSWLSSQDWVDFDQNVSCLYSRAVSAAYDYLTSKGTRATLEPSLYRYKYSPNSLLKLFVSQTASSSKPCQAKFFLRPRPRPDHDDNFNWALEIHGQDQLWPGNQEMSMGRLL